MVRKRLMEMLEQVEQWRVDSDTTIVHRSLGIWVVKTDEGNLEVGTDHHGVPQAYIELDDDLNHAFISVSDLSHRVRPLLDLLGIDK